MPFVLFLKGALRAQSDVGGPPASRADAVTASPLAAAAGSRIVPKKSRNSTFLAAAGVSPFTGRLALPKPGLPGPVGELRFCKP